jgi:hypothetical protein
MTADRHSADSASAHHLESAHHDYPKPRLHRRRAERLRILAKLTDVRPLLNVSLRHQPGLITEKHG